MSAFKGPLPPPQALVGYEDACPGAANRIIKMAESQTKHRQKLEEKTISSNICNEKTGMWLAFALTVILVILGVYLLMNNKETAGFFAMFGPAVFHAVNFIWNKKRESSVPEKKDK